jgi:hypothetical protein
MKIPLKITASLTNQSYLLADHNGWLQMDMVIGVKISLSGVHKIPDICDDLAGVYPKTFVLIGWHLCCHCHVTPVMGSYNTQILEMPQNFIKYVEKNKEQIAEMKIQPDWVKYNFINGDIRNGLIISN